MKKKNTIFIDMDGVVADFDPFVSAVLGRKIGWADTNQDITAEDWVKLGAIDRFYYQLPLMAGATRLVEFANTFAPEYNVQFLTAIPKQVPMATAEADKKAWVEKYFPGMKVDIGPYSRDKQKWATPGDILIDDRVSNIEEWKAAGGFPVYYTGDVEAAIKTISEYVAAG